MTIKVEQSTEIWHRDDFYLIAEWRQYKRIVEVGVDRGEFAQCFLDRWVNKELYLGVDPYTAYSEFPFDRDGDFIATSTKLARFGSCFRLVRASSKTMATAISKDLGTYYWTRPYDLVYIDAAHEYKSVLEDLGLWWPIVADGGMLAGHDWFDTGGDNVGVQQAVREFFHGMGATVYITQDNPSSWYVYKNNKPIKRF